MDYTPRKLIIREIKCFKYDFLIENSAGNRRAKVPDLGPYANFYQMQDLINYK